MKVKVIGIPVQDQEAALQFYTQKLGFVIKHDVPLSENNRWLTVVAKEEQFGTEVLLESIVKHRNFYCSTYLKKGLENKLIPKNGDKQTTTYSSI
jgi:catechol 2,3-dioxygenase-like lactoylglutathione lyase family enzyme